ncbi:hypothetical protein ACIOTI_02550 [Streptomyces sp. NPDC087843]|uniref:hypothetical protein n=1 Tax=Streptomyces sp. NPDC087843 TaxID=3365804 RepID=UPI00381B20D1
MEPDLDTGRLGCRFEIATGYPSAGGQIVSDAFLLASLADHLRVRVSEKDTYLRAGRCLLGELVR